MDDYGSENALAWAVAAANDQALAARYDRFAAYYDGDHDLSFASPKYETAFGRLFRDFSYNRCAAVVDAHADRLFVESFDCAEEADDAAEEAARLIWRANRMDRRQDEVYTESLTMGDAYLLVWPDPETGMPTLWPQRAREVRVRYSDETPGLVTMASKAWRTDDDRIRLNVYLPDRIERWVTEGTRKPGQPLDARLFVPWQDDGAGPVVPNPWDAVPVFAFANNARTGEMGRSELRDVLPLQNALNKSLMDLMVTQEFAAFSQKVIIGIETDPDPYASADPVAAAGNEAQLRNFALGVDRILTIADPAAKIAEFSAAALQQFTEVAEGWDTRISRTSKVPVHYLSLSGNFPSGRALRTAEAPFVAKLEDRQRAFGNVWEDAMRLALRMAGMPTPDEEFSVVWRSAAPMAEEDSWDIVLQMVAAGIPVEVAVKEELGWDDDQVARLAAALDSARAAESLAMMVAPRSDPADVRPDPEPASASLDEMV